MRPARPVALPALALAVLLPAVSPGLAADALRLRLQEGDQFRYRLDQEQSTHLELGPMGTQTADSTTHIAFRQTVKEVRDDGTVVLEVIYEQMSMDNSSPVGDMEFDLAGDESSAGKMGELILNRPFLVELSDRNEVRRVEGVDAMWEEAGSALPEDQKTQQMFQLLKGSFSDEAIHGMLEGSYPRLPREPLSPGLVWSSRSEIANPAVGEIILDVEYTFVGFERKNRRDCARIGVVTSTRMPEDLPILEQLRSMFSSQGLESELSVQVGEAVGKGTVWIDRMTGLLVASEGHQKTDMDFHIVLTQDEQSETMELGMSMDIRFGMALQDPKR